MFSLQARGIINAIIDVARPASKKQLVQNSQTT